MVKFRVKPTQKENWRYIAFEIISDASFNEKEVIKAVSSSILHLLGAVGASKTNFWLISYDQTSKKGLLRCSNKAQKEVIASITTITKIENTIAILNVLGVSGTIKKAKEKYLSKKRRNK